MKVGIIGSGLIAQVHGPVIRSAPGATLVGIADRDLARAKAAAADLQVAGVYADAEAMIEAEKPEVVHVLTPPATHAEVAIAAMRRGCHVLVEKPMAHNLGDAERMVAAARELGVKLCVGHNMLYEDSIRRALDIAESGVLGEIVSADAYFAYNARRNPALLEEGAEHSHWSYRLNGGPLQDQMPHLASLVFECVPEIAEVHVAQRHRGVLPAGFPDEIRVLVAAAGGFFGTIAISFSERPDTILFTLRGKGGTVQADLFGGFVTVARSSTLPRAAARGLSGFRGGGQLLRGAAANLAKFATGRVDKSNGIARLVERFYDSIRAGGEPPVALDKSLRVVELIDRIWPAPVVTLPAGPPVRHRLASPRGQTALVTGASGFIGCCLVRRLLEGGVRVRALLRPNSIHSGRLAQYEVETVVADLSDRDQVRKAVEGASVIFHVGAPMTNQWREHEQVTLESTRTLVGASLELGIERLVHVSTLAVCDLLGVAPGATVREDVPYQPNSERMGPYAHFKIEAEKEILSAVRERGLRAAIVRPGIVIGPGGRLFFPHLGFKNGDTLFLVIGKGTNLLPLTYVENTVEGMIRASVEERAVGQIYHLVDDGRVTVNDYLSAFVAETGVAAKILHIPFALPWAAAGAYEAAAALKLLKAGATSRDQIRWKNRRVVFDNAKAKRELGWVERAPVEEGMRRMFEWYRAERARG